MPILKLESGSDKGKIYPIEEQKIIIGREPGPNGIVITGKNVSRKHATITPMGELIMIKDLGSMNGTYVNNIKITEQVLAEGDVIKIGGNQFLFSAEENDLYSDEIEYSDEFADDSDSTIRISIDSIDSEENQISESNEYFKVLYKISQKISKSENFRDTLQNVIKLIGDALKSDKGYVVLLDGGDKKKLNVKASISGGKVSLSKTIIKQVLEGKNAVLTKDASQDLRFITSQSIYGAKIKSVICAPIVSGRQIVGFIYIEGDGLSKVFGSKELELVMSSAFELGIIFGNLIVVEKAKRTLLSAIKCLVSALELHNPQIKGHSERVALYALAIAEEYGLSKSKPLSQSEKTRVYISGLLHDIGKLFVMREAASKPEKKEHVLKGESLLSGIDGMTSYLDGVKFHHEKVTGDGYPFGVAKGDFPIIAQFIGLANVFDNLGNYMSSGNLPDFKQIVLDVSIHCKDDYNKEVIDSFMTAYKKGTLMEGKKDFIL